MLRQWRRAALVALVGAAAVAAQLAATSPAQAAAPAITIAATSKLPPVTHDVLVAYRAGAYANAKIHGSISGAAAGDVAALYAQQFPYKKPAVRLGSITLKAATATYSFTVTPTLATKYAVRLFASSTATTPIASSRVQNLYVTAGGSFTAQYCNTRPVCHETIHVYTVLPSSALSIEMSKHFYPYFGVSLSPTKVPPPPKWLYLNGGHAKVSKSRRINAITYETTFTFSFTVGNDGYYPLWAACAKDTLSKDGLGLPGSHGCGVSRVLATVAYLG